jgi:hypothetical protein
MRHVITLPNGRQCSVGIYARAWRELLAADPATGASRASVTSLSARRDIVSCDARRHERAHQPARRGDTAAAASGARTTRSRLWRDSRRVRDIANRIRVYQFETIEARSRFADRLAGRDD